MTMNKAITEYLRYHKLMGHTNKTISNYHDVLTQFVKFTGDIDIEDINIDLIRDYQESLINRGLSNTTVANYLTHIKAFINYLIEEYDLTAKDLPNRIKMPRKKKRIVDLFTSEQVRLIFNSISAESEWLRLRNCLLVALMYDSGLRQEELTKINLQDINRDNNLLLVHGKGNKERFVPLGATTLKYLDLYLDCRPFDLSFLFCNRRGDRITTNAVKQFMQDLRNKTGLKNLSSHKLRHNFATNYCINQYKKTGNVDIYKLVELMGHEDVETTRIYLHLAQQFIASSGFISMLDNITA